VRLDWVWADENPFAVAAEHALYHVANSFVTGLQHGEATWLERGLTHRLLGGHKHMLAATGERCEAITLDSDGSESWQAGCIEICPGLPLVRLG
jgi:hypothetical protein